MPDLTPGIDVINTFKNQNTLAEFAIGEYVDNSIDSYFKNKKDLLKLDPDFRPFIDITFDSYENTLVIEDNCAGIHKEDEIRAFSIGSKNPNENDIGTYGMGMKVSSFWFCPTWEVETKPLREGFKKTFKVNIESVLKNRASEDSSVKSDAEPYTKITLKNIYPGKISKDTKQLADIQRYLSEIYRFMLIEESITIRFNGKPLSYKAPDIFEKRYIDDKKGDAITWVAQIPEIHLGTVERGGKEIELKALGGLVYIKNTGRGKEKKGFSLFWKKRLVAGHEQKPWMPGSEHYSDERLHIYGASNQFRATRLEGYIHLSPSFQVPSTKDGVRWEGTEEKLVMELKKFLENATILGDESGKKYNFLKQCSSIGKIKDEDVEELIDPEKVIRNMATKDEDVIILPANIDDEEDDPSFFNQNNNTYRVKYEQTTWEVDIKTIRNEDDKLYKIIKGPFGKEGDETRQVGLKVNCGHSFYRHHFPQNDLEEQVEGVIKFCIALALAESISAESGGNQAAKVRLIFNQIIDSLAENY